MLAPTITPYPWQAAVAARLLEQHRLAVEAAPGAGKTLAAIVAAQALEPASVLIIAPPGRVARQWLRVCQQSGATSAAIHGERGQGGVDLAAALLSARSAGTAARPAVCILPWSRLARINDAGPILHMHDGCAERWGLLVVDESHYAQGAEDVARGRTLLGWYDGRARRAHPGLRHYADHTLALSGTPATSDPKRIRAQLLLAGLLESNPELSTRYKYEARHWGGRQKYSYAAKRLLWECDDTPSPDHAPLIRAGLVRVSPDELRAQLPAHRRVLRPDWTPGAPPPSDLVAWAEARAAGKTAPLPQLEMLADMRREATVARAGEIAQEVAAWHEEAEPGAVMLVWCCYQDSAEHLASAITDALRKAEGPDGPCEAVALHGGLGDRQRATRLADTIAGKVRVLVATHASTGVGVDGLQLVACRALCAEAPWTPGECEQTEGRLLRTGQARPVLTEWISAGIEGAVLKGCGIKAGALGEVLQAAEVLALSTPATAPAASTQADDDWADWLST